MTLSIRSGQPGDSDAMRQCIAQAYATAARTVTGLPDVTAGVEDALRIQPVFVAEIDGAIQGIVILAIREDGLWVSNLAVHPDASGQGLGGALLDHAETVARAHDLSDMRLTTHVDMTGAQAFYTARGWRETGREGHRLFMAKPLA